MRTLVLMITVRSTLATGCSSGRNDVEGREGSNVEVTLGSVVSDRTPDLTSIETTSGPCDLEPSRRPSVPPVGEIRAREQDLRIGSIEPPWPEFASAIEAGKDWCGEISGPVVRNVESNGPEHWRLCDGEIFLEEDPVECYAHVTLINPADVIEQQSAEITQDSIDGTVVMERGKTVSGVGIFYHDSLTFEFLEFG